MTLHDAIILLLTNSSSSSMTTVEIAEELNKQGLYQRKDGEAIQPSQVGARVRQYEHLFITIDGQISLRSE